MTHTEQVEKKIKYLVQRLPYIERIADEERAIRQFAQEMYSLGVKEGESAKEVAIQVIIDEAKALGVKEGREEAVEYVRTNLVTTTPGHFNEVLKEALTHPL